MRGLAKFHKFTGTYHSKDFPDDTVELSDYRVDDSTLTFSDPKSVGVDNLAVPMTGVMPARGELQGTAESDKPTDNGKVVLIGSWSLKKVTRDEAAAPN